jgi:ankyrin repeat protein
LLIFKAASNNQLAALNILISAGANVSIKDSIGGRTPLMWGKDILLVIVKEINFFNLLAAQNGYLPIVTQLCLKGADINAQATSSRKTALMWGKN